MCSKMKTKGSIANFSEEIEKLEQALNSSDSVIIGAGAGLSTSAGFSYGGERFKKYFSDFGTKYGFSDMYSGGFYPYAASEEFWAFWSRDIHVNRYMNAPKPVYDNLLKLIEDKDYFVITTNVDHCFQKAGFDKKRLFYTQGDYGLFQCSEPCSPVTYDNQASVRAMVEAQGFNIEESGELTLKDGTTADMAVPSELIPVCPRCGKPMSMNLRADDSFVEDDGWHKAAQRYSKFLKTRSGKRIFLELGVGFNTPGIIKLPFMKMTAQDENSIYASINLGEAYCPEQIKERSILIDADIGEALELLCRRKTLTNTNLLLKY